MLASEHNHKHINLDIAELSKPYKDLQIKDSPVSPPDPGLVDIL